MKQSIEDWLAAPRTVKVRDLPSASSSGATRRSTYSRYEWWGGESYSGGYGTTRVLVPDYWILRQRSHELYETNPYARGLFRRLITNEINTGLEVAAVPEEGMLGLAEGSLDDWTEDVENRFHVWSMNPRSCDWRERARFGKLQATMRLNAFLGGDILCVLRQDRRTNLPKLQFVDGRLVQSPLAATPDLRSNQRIVHGVELDSRDRHVAYWVLQRDGTHRRLPAYGARSGRLQAWLVYGTDHKLDDVRGRPLLSLFLQMLKEVDRYRDAALRKAVINSLLAMFIKKEQDKIPSMPISGGATRRGTDVTIDERGNERVFDIAELIPGLVVEELNAGETPEAFGSGGTDEKFGDFQRAMLDVYAWANEIPPEILHLGFTNNYSASQAALNEFKIYLNRIRADIGQEFCAPIYRAWLLSSVLNGTIVAPGLLDAFRNRQDDVYGAWNATEWWGHIKPSTDVLKQAKGQREMIAMGWTNHDLVARELTGTKWSKNIKKLKAQNPMLAEANESLQMMEQQGNGEGATEDPDADDNRERTGT